jgi:hypothetical protein
MEKIGGYTYKKVAAAIEGWQWDEEWQWLSRSGTVG